MIAYVDSSVLLRVALAQPNALPEWRRIDRGVSSALLATESLRTLDRNQLAGTGQAFGAWMNVRHALMSFSAANRLAYGPV